jgi:hypothetical protein
MKNKLFAIWALPLLCTLPFQLSTAFAQGTAFTYQGQLDDGTNAANGAYDLRFHLYNALTNGSVVAGPLTNLATPVNNGQFTVTIDFGDVFTGTNLWLQIGVRTNGANNFVVVTPRQELTPTPYSIFAEGANAAGLSGAIPAASLSGIFSQALDLTNAGNIFAGNGAGLSNINAAALGGVAASSFWQLGGNTAPAGSFLGTVNNQPLDFMANNVRAMRLRLTTDGAGIFSNAPNIIAGSPVNVVSLTSVGGTISGGGGNDMSGNTYPNLVMADFATVSGGLGNTASGPGSVIGGGGTDGQSSYPNSASGVASVIGGGYNNTNTGVAATIGGGDFNQAAGNVLFGGATVGGGVINKATTDLATVSGGSLNTASAFYATVPGGLGNVAGGQGSFAAGQDAQTTHVGTFIWGDGTATFTGANADDAFNVLATGGVFFYNGSNGVSVDHGDQNNGSIYYGLRFGETSGEGMASKRTAGGNQHGLDFYTGFNNVMSIANNGFVGLNTTAPSQRLEVNGQYALIDGGSADDGDGAIDAYIGGSGSGSDVQVGSMNPNITAVGFWNNAAGAWMHIGCSSITINGGSDLAEPFKISSGQAEVPQGAVVVIDKKNPGQLKMSDQPYDRHVAGVVSGANGINPGIQMQQQGLLDGGKNVALTGRVYVLADGSNGPIEPGDLLTTSASPGRAMKVTDYAKAQGAILGKAMSSLEAGKGLVLVLVTLQ